MNEILESAERVFEHHGYGETSLRQLLAGTAISTTAFYARFSSKEDVLAALVDRMLGDLASQAATELTGARSLEEGFDRGVQVLVRVLREHRIVARLALAEAPGSPKVRATLAGAYTTLATLLAARIRKINPDADAPSLAWALVGALQIQVMRWAVFDDLSDTALPRTLRATAHALLPALK